MFVEKIFENAALEAARRNRVKAVSNEISAKIKDFILKGVEVSGESSEPYGDESGVWPVHGHLGFESKNFWGHYIFPTKSGFKVTVYEQSQINGNPLDIEGTRGESFQLEVNLSQREKVKVFERSRAWDHNSNEWSNGRIAYKSEEDQKYVIFSCFWENVIAEYDAEASKISNFAVFHTALF